MFHIASIALSDILLIFGHVMDNKIQKCIKLQESIALPGPNSFLNIKGCIWKFIRSSLASVSVAGLVSLMAVSPSHVSDSPTGVLNNNEP